MGREEWSMTERKKICRDCYKELTESGARLGVCRNCACLLYTSDAADEL